MTSSLLLSRTVASAPLDKLKLRWGSNVQRMAVLAGGAASTAKPAEITGMLAALGDEAWWAGLTDVHVGRSLEVDADPTLIAGLIGAAKLASKKELKVHWKGGTATKPSPFGQWLYEGFGPENRPWHAARGLPRGDMEYFIASGGYRAHALITLLRANFRGRTFSDVSDIGAGMGFMAFLIAAYAPFGVKQVRLIEPSTKNAWLAKKFWEEVTPDAQIAVRVREKKAEAFGFSKANDLVFVCQSLYHVPEGERAAVVKRIWDSLRPGGLFAVNEMVTDETVPVHPGGNTVPILRRDALAAMLAVHAEPKLFQRRDRWAKPRAAMSVSASDYRSDSFLVIEKPL